MWLPGCDFRRGGEVRGDRTVVATDIHEPSDSGLLYDCVRVIIRELKRSGVEEYHNRVRSAKKRLNEIRNSKGWKMLRGRYRVQP